MASDAARKGKEGWYLKTSAKPAERFKGGAACFRLSPKDAKTSCMLLKAHVILHTLGKETMTRAVYTQLTVSPAAATPKASKTQPWQIFLLHLMPTQITSSHSETDPVSYKLFIATSTTNWSHIGLLFGNAKLFCTNMSGVCSLKTPENLS